MCLENCGAFSVHQNLDTTEDRLYANAPVVVIGIIKRALSKADGQPSSAGLRNNDMKENNKNQPLNFQLPPLWCSAICRNAMSEICVESCAITKDMTGFDPKPDISLLDMPRFPIKDSGNMTKEERFTSVAIYLAKIVDYLQGDENDDKYHITRRPDFDSSRSSSVSKSVKVKDLLSNIHETNSLSEVGSECEDQAIRPSEVVDSTD